MLLFALRCLTKTARVVGDGKEATQECFVVVEGLRFRKIILEKSVVFGRGRWLSRRLIVREKEAVDPI